MNGAACMHEVLVFRWDQLILVTLLVAGPWLLPFPLLFPSPLPLSPLYLVSPLKHHPLVFLTSSFFPSHHLSPHIANLALWVIASQFTPTSLETVHLQLRSLFTIDH